MAMILPTRPKFGGPVDAAQIDWPGVLAQHEHWLRTIVFARLGSGHEVEEVMQEVSLAAVKQQAPLTDPNKVAPWLYRLAVTQSLLYRRRQGRRRKLVDRYAQRVRPSKPMAANWNRWAGCWPTSGGNGSQALCSWPLGNRKFSC